MAAKRTARTQRTQAINQARARVGRASAGRCDPVNLIRRRAGHGIGVEDRGDGLDSVDQAGSGTYHDAVSVDRPHRDAGKVPGC